MRPSRKPFPSANLNPTVSTLPRLFESLTSYPRQALTFVLSYPLNSTLQPGLLPLLPIPVNGVYPGRRSRLHRDPVGVLKSPRPTLVLPASAMSGRSIATSGVCESRPGRDHSEPRALSSSPKSLPHNIFADPHSLTPVRSILYKKVVRRGYPGIFQPSTLDFQPLPKSFICNTYRSPRKCCKQKTYGSG